VLLVNHCRQNLLSDCGKSQRFANVDRQVVVEHVLVEILSDMS
jgi:hypothetical protein